LADHGNFDNWQVVQWVTESLIPALSPTTDDMCVCFLSWHNPCIHNSMLLRDPGGQGVWRDAGCATPIVKKGRFLWVATLGSSAPRTLKNHWGPGRRCLWADTIADCCHCSHTTQQNRERQQRSPTLPTAMRRARHWQCLPGKNSVCNLLLPDKRAP
jgi:hypothetical protein